MVDYFSSTTLLSRKKTTIMLSLFLLCLYGCGNINNEKPYTFNPEEESRISDSILAIRKTLDSNKVERYKKNILLDKARFKLKKKQPN